MNLIVKLCICFIIILVYTNSVSAQANYIEASSKFSEHPRIIMTMDIEEALKKNIAMDTLWSRINSELIRECDAMLNAPVAQRIMEGRRMLQVSKDVGRRLFFLSYAYRMTKEKKYAERAEQEMLTVSSFIDWNPSHFLDVAEMTFGMAVGYDWLFDFLSIPSKKIIRESIVSKGLKPSLTAHNWWLESSTNWNQICNTGISYGAVAVFENYPDICSKIINRAIESIKIPMDGYQPDGVYHEGYSYWSGGTDFNVLFIDLLESCLGNDFGLSKMSYFMKTPYFRLNLLGPTGKAFLWGDGSTRGRISPAMFWFAKKINSPNLLWDERKYLKADQGQIYLRERLLPAIIIWGSNIKLSKLSEPKSLIWNGRGKVPVLVMRTSWTNPNAIFVGFKGGSPSISHAHMDIGAFIMEANGIRWAIDLGAENYNSIEEKGIDLWNMKQDGQRWSLFRYNNLSHNTLTVNGSLQRVDSHTPIIKFLNNPMFMGAIIDMTKVYDDQLQDAKRGVAIVDKQYVLVRDEILNKDHPSKLRWNMVTDAEVKILDNNTIKLIKNRKKLILKAQANAKLSARIWPAQPASDFEAPTQGKTFVGFDIELDASSKTNIEVLLIPKKSIVSKSTWSNKLDLWK